MGPEEAATEDLKQRLDVHAIKQSALLTRDKPEPSQILRASSKGIIAIPLKEYVSTVKAAPPRAPLMLYDDAQQVAYHEL